MTDILLALILAVLVAQNAQRFWRWAASMVRVWRKKRNWKRRGY